MVYGLAEIAENLRETDNKSDNDATKLSQGGLIDKLYREFGYISGGSNPISKEESQTALDEIKEIVETKYDKTTSRDMLVDAIELGKEALNSNQYLAAMQKLQATGGEYNKELTQAEAANVAKKMQRQAEEYQSPATAAPTPYKKEKGVQGKKL